MWEIIADKISGQWQEWLILMLMGKNDVRSVTLRLLIKKIESYADLETSNNQTSFASKELLSLRVIKDECHSVGSRMNWQDINRSIPTKVFLRKGVLKTCRKFTGEHPYRSVTSMKLLCIFAAYFQNMFS